MRSERTDGIRVRPDPQWDDLREQRVLTNVLEARRRAPERLARRRAARLWQAGAGIAVAAALAVSGGYTFLGARRASTNAGMAATAGAPGMVREAGPSITEFADGSRATLSPDASIRVVEQQPMRVLVEQLQGSVAYEVTHNPEREFAVLAGDVRVRVRGTKFSVKLGPEGTEVLVQQGRVEVDSGDRMTQLSDGEALSVRVSAPVTAEAHSPTAGAEAARPPGPGAHSAVRAAPPAARAVDELLRQADEARARGATDDAAQALYTLVQNHSGDPRATSAWFTLGRIESSRERFGQAARAYERCWRGAPGGALAADAHAHEAEARLKAGDVAGARNAAEAYLERYPNGPGAERMRDIMR